MDEFPTTPLPLPTLGEQTPTCVIVFGGTFDPAHLGHVRLPMRVRDEAEQRNACEGRAWLLYVPAARSPFKDAGPVASDDERIEMLRLAISDMSRAAVWTDEIDRAKVEGPLSERGGRQSTRLGEPGYPVPAPSYTIDTLTRLREWLDQHNLIATRVYLLIGADQALSFHSWRQPRDILRLAKPLVMIRGDASGARAADALADKIGATGFWDAQELAIWAGAIVPVGKIDVSATQVRAALANGTDEDILKLVPAPVLEYARMRGLYSR